MLTPTARRQLSSLPTIIIQRQLSSTEFRAKSLTAVYGRPIGPLHRRPGETIVDGRASSRRRHVRHTLSFTCRPTLWAPVLPILGRRCARLRCSLIAFGRVVSLSAGTRQADGACHFFEPGSPMNDPASSPLDDGLFAPFKVRLAERMNRLPPYLFGRIDACCTRSGGPATTSSTSGWAIRRIRLRTSDRETGRCGSRSGESRLQPIDRHHEPPPRGRQQVPEEIRRAARS